MHPSSAPAAQADFVADVLRALRVWRQAPLLPAAILAVGLLQLLSGSSSPAVSGFAGLLGLLLLGWTGAERLWYLRVWTGRSLTPGEALSATMHCFGRFFVLSLVVGVAVLLLLIPVGVAAAMAVQVTPDAGAQWPGGTPLWVDAYVAVVLLVAYAALTFVTPAITFTSKRVREAVPIGLRLLRDSWPRTAAYVVVPALATAATVVPGYDHVDATALAVTLATTVVVALCRGATAAYYLRTVGPAGPDGAIRVAPEPGFAPPPRDW